MDAPDCDYFSKNQYGTNFKKWNYNHGKNICRQQLPLPHKAMLGDFYNGLHFTSISQHCKWGRGRQISLILQLSINLFP